MNNATLTWLLKIGAALVAVLLIAGTVYVLENWLDWELGTGLEFVMVIIGIVAGGAIVKPLGNKAFAKLDSTE